VVFLAVAVVMATVVRVVAVVGQLEHLHFIQALHCDQLLVLEELVILGHLQVLPMRAVVLAVGYSHLAIPAELIQAVQAVVVAGLVDKILAVLALMAWVEVEVEVALVQVVHPLKAVVLAAAV
jgi:hypothetical protein